VTGDAYELQFPDAHFDLLMNNTCSIGCRKRFSFGPGGVQACAQAWWSLEYRQNDTRRLNPRWLGVCRGMLLLEHLQRAGFQNVHREMLSQSGFRSKVISAKAAARRQK